MNGGMATGGRPCLICLVSVMGRSDTGNDISVTPYARVDAPTTTKMLRAKKEQQRYYKAP